MKILFISDVPCSNPFSGSEQVLNQQAFGLSRRGFNIFAITRTNGESRSPIIRAKDGVQEACYSISSKNTIRIISSLLKKPSQIFRYFNQNGPHDAFICHQPFTYFSLLLAGKLKKIPIIYVFHSPNHEEYLLLAEDIICWWKLLLAYIRKAVEGYCLKRARKIIVLSKYMQQKAIQIHKISRDRIEINPGGVDLERFKRLENRNRIKTELGYSVGKVHLLTVRNLEPRMGLDILLKGFSLLRDRNIPVELIIGGEGPEKKKLQKMLNDLGLVGDVTLTGLVPPEKLPLYYSAADFFVLPSQDLEGFGLVTPESMACGTPVLGTPVGGTNEILRNFNSQFLFHDITSDAMADGIQRAITDFLTDEKEYNRLRARCRQYAAQYYSWRRHIDKLESIVVQSIESEELKKKK